MSEQATYTVELGIDPYVDGIFTLDSSLLDDGTGTVGPDVLPGDFVESYGTDITADVKSIEYGRGRSGDFSAMEAGTCTIVLHDPDGTYNPSNTSGTYYGQLRPLVPVRVQAAYGGNTYGCFAGYITKIMHDPALNVQETVIEAEDMFQRLQRARVIVTTMTDQLVSAVITQILANSQIGAGMRDIGTSTHTVPSYANAGSNDSLSEIQSLLAIDQGVFFIAGDGKATYIPHATWYSAGAAVATLGDTLAGGMRSGISIDGIINKQTVLRTTGVAQTYYNNPSIDDFGYCVGSGIESAYIETDTQALNLARFIVGICGQPRPPAQQVSLINASGTILTQILTRELGDIVTVSDTRSGTSVTGQIEAMQHTISDGGTIHRCKFTVRQRPATVPTY